MIKTLFNISLLLLFHHLTFAQVNLPQSRVEVNIKIKDHQSLKKYFGSFDQLPVQLDDKTEKLLLNLLPKEYQKGCNAMIAHWGEIAKNTATTAVRVLYLKNLEKNIQQIFLTYTCFSMAREYGDKYYDERLAVLTIDSASSKLTMYPHAKPCDNCSELTRMALEEDDISIGGNPAICIIFGISSKNPCCNGPISFDEDILKYFIIQPTGVVDALTFRKYRRETIHDDEAGDSTTGYRTNIDTEKDGTGNI
ncbi:MAG: hypothetical protein HY800_05930 [Ignavibacteriales bacterium]|nr:hypothetical protein [Ignavibacteriales bacterium]